MNGIVFYIPEELAVTPAEGHAYVNRWWTVHPEKGLAFYTTKRRHFEVGPGEEDEPSPQCNSNEFTARHLAQRAYPGHDVKFFPVVFIRHAMREQKRVREEARAMSAAQETK